MTDKGSCYEFDLIEKRQAVKEWLRKRMLGFFNWIYKPLRENPTDRIVILLRPGTQAMITWK